MKRLIGILTLISIFVSVTSVGFTASTQKPKKDQDDSTLPSTQIKKNLPPNLERGATPEAKAAWEKLTPEQREEVKRNVDEAFKQAKEQAKQEKRDQKAERKTWKDIVKGKQKATEPETTLLFSDKLGGRKSIKANDREAAPSDQAVEPAAKSKARQGNNERQLAKAGRQNGGALWGGAAKLASGHTGSKNSFVKAGWREASSMNHAPRAAKMLASPQSTCVKTVDQYVAEFYQGALGRQPNPAEAQQWSNALAQGQAQGESQLIAAAQNMGRALFESQEYINRGRSDRDYVADLYWAWLQRAPDQGGWDFWTGGVGRDGRGAVLNAFEVAGESHDLLRGLCSIAYQDADGDYLTDGFENRLADAFTPIYHISAYESDNFVSMNNSVPQTVQQRFGQTPFSYFRVQPLGFDYNYYGQLVSVIRIDYLALMDRDGGLVTGGACDAFPGLNGFEGVLAHDIDNERSAVLVAAPVWDYTYNTDPFAYSAYSYYTAAHENTITDKSRYADFPTQPVPAGWHIHLAMSLSKHGTYTFNPDYLSLLPDYIIWSTIAGIDYYCYRSTFDPYYNWRDLLCLGAMYYAYGAFYGCAVERFFDQGGRFAERRINVGEPNTPINGAGFIQDDSHALYSKLVNPTF
ncbi:MAG: DUF4214 domain-containing protein [Pyrinomonadaceae bacterium]